MTEKLSRLRIEATGDTSSLNSSLQETERRVTATSGSVERLKRQLDEGYDSAQRFASGAMTLQKALDTGKISADEHARFTQLLGQRYSETGGRVEGFREILRLTTDSASGNITGMGRAGAMLANSFGLITLEAAGVATGILAVGTVLAMAALRANDAAAQTREYQAILIATGNTAQLTGNQILLIARDQARTGPF